MSVPIGLWSFLLAGAVAAAGPSNPARAAARPAAPPSASDASTAWRPGPAPLVYLPARILRLSDGRVMAYGSGVASCSGFQFCTPARDSAPAAAIWDTDRGVSNRVADPPANVGFGSGPAGLSDAAVDGDVYFGGSTRVPPGQPPTSIVVRYRTAADRWELLASPQGIGNSLSDYNWTVAAGRPMLVRGWYDPKRPEPSGALLADDGNWRLIPLDPFASDKQRPQLVAVGDELLALGGAGRTTKVAALAISAHGPVGRWRMLPAIRRAGAQGHVAAVAGLLVWHDLVYDPRTGRSTPTPQALRTRPTDDPEQVRLGEAPDGLVVGDRVTFSNALFDPRSGTWAELPAPPSREADPNEPKAPGEQVRPGSYDWIGGPHDFVRLYEGDLLVTGSDPGPLSETARPGRVDVLTPEPSR